MNLEIKLTNKVYKLICKSFKKTKNIDKILISKASNNFSIHELTFDKRHIKSKNIDLVKRKTLCTNYQN